MARFYNEDGTWIEDQATRQNMEGWIGGHLDFWFNKPRKGQALVFRDTFLDGAEPNPTVQALFGDKNGPVFGKAIHCTSADLRCYAVSERRRVRHERAEQRRLEIANRKRERAEFYQWLRTRRD